MYSMRGRSELSRASCSAVFSSRSIRSGTTTVPEAAEGPRLTSSPISRDSETDAGEAGF